MSETAADTETMYVLKRDGSREPVSFDKVLARIRKAGRGLSVDVTRLAQLVIAEIHDGVKTSDLDEMAARLAISYMTQNPDWGTLAAQIIVSNCQKNAPPTFSAAMEELAGLTDARGLPAPALHDDVIAFVRANVAVLDAMVRPENDFLLDYFGFKTLEKAYLMKSAGRIVETPQYMWLRVAVGIHYRWPDALTRIEETYALMSAKAFTHATPTLFNAGTPRPQLSSCFLVAMKDDSIEGIFDTIKECAQISKYAGGIGLHVHNIRAQGTSIAGTQGTSNGLVPMLRVFNNTARYVDQGGGRRNGSFAIYLEPWHADIQSFLKLKSNTGSEEERARDLFYALWVPDLFMKRVEAGGDWSLFCPHEAPGLADVVGAEFEALYTRYEAEGRARRTVPAQKLWSDILVSQIETGTPYLVYKDAANLKSNQKNLGVIKSSNLCSEIVEYSDASETAVCNLASIALPYFLETDSEGRRHFNYDKLRAIVAVIVRNLNRVIDINYYPTPETKRSNLRHRPIGIGIQGLADVFAMMGMAWETPEAARLNQEIFENIYYAAVEQSHLMALQDAPYETFRGSPASQGLLQPDLWGADAYDNGKRVGPLCYSQHYLDWTALREKVARDGLRNSLLLAPMPTASTSQILGYNECITGDALVSLPNGIAKRLDACKSKQAVLSYDETSGEITQSNQYEFIPKGVKSTKIITLQDGRVIKCTDSHKFFTAEGWKEAHELTSEDILTVAPIGTEDKQYDDESTWALHLGETILQMNTEEERNRTLAFARILGFIRTDGSLQKTGKVTAVLGTEYDTHLFINDCNVIAPSTTSYSVKAHNGTFTVTINGILRKMLLNTAGVSHGTRVSQPITWPEFIVAETCPRAVLREFLAGMFGGDGLSPCLVKNGNSTVFSRIMFGQSACPQNKDSLLAAMQQLCALLDRVGVHGATVGNIRKYKSTRHTTFRCGDEEHISIKIQLPQKIDSFKMFMDNIGIRYCSHKLNRCEIAAAWSRYYSQVLSNYNSIMSTAYTHSQNYTGKGRFVRALAESIKSNTPTNNSNCCTYQKPTIAMFYDYIKRIKKTPSYTISSIKLRNFITASQFTEMTETSHWFNDMSKTGKKKKVYASSKYGLTMPSYSLKVLSVEPGVEEEVYDINVEKTHTFMANGAVVHNCIEPFTTNIYTRRTLAGEFIVVNRHLVADLTAAGLWTPELKERIIAANGSIQQIPEIPAPLKERYKTVWEIKQKTLIDMAADRGAYICQSQSLNLFVQDPTIAKLSSMHFYAWRRGLKTGIYYLRTKSAVQAIKFTVDPSLLKAQAHAQTNKPADDKECLLCSS